MASSWKLLKLGLLLSLNISPPQGKVIIPSVYQINVDTPSENGSSSFGHCNGTSRTIFNNFQCNNPRTSVLFDQMIHLVSLRNMDSMWASQLLIIQSTQPFARLTSDFFVEGLTRIDRVEIVMFNCPRWRIGVQAITLNFFSQSIERFYRKNVTLSSCEYLVRVSIKCTGSGCTIVPIPGNVANVLFLQFHHFLGITDWVHVAEVTIVVNSTTTDPPDAVLTPPDEVTPPPTTITTSRPEPTQRFTPSTRASTVLATQTSTTNTTHPAGINSEPANSGGIPLRTILIILFSSLFAFIVCLISIVLIIKKGIPRDVLLIRLRRPYLKDYTDSESSRSRSGTSRKRRSWYSRNRDTMTPASSQSHASRDRRQRTPTDSKHSRKSEYGRHGRKEKRRSQRSRGHEHSHHSSRGRERKGQDASLHSSINSEDTYRSRSKSESDHYYDHKKRKKRSKKYSTGKSCKESPTHHSSSSRAQHETEFDEEDTTTMSRTNKSEESRRKKEKKTHFAIDESNEEGPPHYCSKDWHKSTPTSPVFEGHEKSTNSERNKSSKLERRKRSKDRCENKSHVPSHSEVKKKSSLDVVAS